MKTYYAVHHYEIIPCHRVALKDRDGRGSFAANSRRDKRRFQVAYATIQEARDKVVEYEIQKKWELYTCCPQKYPPPHRIFAIFKLFIKRITILID